MKHHAAVPSDSFPIESGVVESELGCWKHSHCRPIHLTGLVEHIWLFDGTMSCLRERTFPNGLLEIIVHLGDRYSVVERSGSWVCPVTCVTGFQLNHLIVEAPGHRTKVLGVRLTPAGAYAIFGRPMHELTRLTVDLEDLSGRAAVELAERCDGAASSEQCLRAAVGWVDERLMRGTRIDPVVGWMLDQIRQRRGTVSIGTLRDRTGYSKTSLAAAFQREVGVSPKQYARVIRFTHALTRIHRQEGPLAEVAADLGYYDQPHLNAEFKELSGFTPTEFLNAQRYPNSVSVAET